MMKRSPAAAAACIGFALGGFFDGILLHQILQWHHLLSRVPSMQSLETQILADGLFHALMYVLALLGLAAYWRQAPGSRLEGRALAAQLLLGFAAWHVVDTLLSHWLLGIHRIRMDSTNPLFWDLLWLLLFGLAPLLLGLWLRRQARLPPAVPRGPGAASALTVAVLLAGTVAALPPRDADTVLLVLQPGADVGAVLAESAQRGGGVLWANRAGTLWALRFSDADASALQHEDVLLALRAPLGLGCLSWSQPRTQAAS